MDEEEQMLSSNGLVPAIQQNEVDVVGVRSLNAVRSQWGFFSHEVQSGVSNTPYTTIA
jgi:hypothetical protein